MTLGERIKECRQNAKLSQEKVAELVGVSRQAVTKWETNQSMPNTENLFKLAEIFGTTVDMLIPAKETTKNSLAEQYKKNFQAALMVLVGYLVVYVIGRCICGDFKNSSFIGWLFGTDSKYYLYGWLLTSDLFWISMAISALPSLFGKYRFSLVTFVTFTLGILIGEWLGPVPEPAIPCNTHNGWIIWGGMFLGAIVVGIIWEIILKKSKKVKQVL